jgi:cyclopropane fatty-acyl-phospholipid synthase-like methyltransferase
MTNQNNDELTCFWNDAQRQNKRFELTGSELRAVELFLNLSSKLKPNNKVLNIGVGFGYCTRELVKRGLIVSALDISPLALSRVKDVIENRYTPKQLNQMPTNYFDVIISYLVTQHMTNQQLTIQLTECIRSLKTEGIFAIQFASSKSKNLTDDKSINTNLMKRGMVTRSFTFMNHLVNSCGGIITWHSFPVYFPRYHLSWYGIHIKKISSEPENYTWLDSSVRFLSLVIYYLGLVIRRMQ